MKAIIVEDELASARRLERMLSNFTIEIEAKLTTVKQAVLWLKNNKQPDILFLDIQLADGLCFEIFEQVQITSKIIFTTAYSKYSIKAFNYDSLHYLLKPIKTSDLETAIKKAVLYKENETQFLKLKELFENYETEIYKTSFAIKIGTKLKIINVDEVLYFESFDNATYIKYLKGKGIVNYSLTQLEKELNPKLFFRVNRSFYVSKKSVISIDTYFNSRLKLTIKEYDQAVIVSRNRVKDFKNWIG